MVGESEMQLSSNSKKTIEVEICTEIVVFRQLSWTVKN